MGKGTDLLVIGGGPAGSATAIAARRAGLSVCLVDKAHLPFTKVCGEFLSSPGMEIFERLTGIARDRFPRLETIVFVSPAGSGKGSRVTRHRSTGTPVLRLDPPAWGVRRSTLDSELLAVCAAVGVDVRFGLRVVRSVHQDGTWSVDAHPNDRPEMVQTFRATRVVRADGRRPAAGDRQWIGRKTYSAPASPDSDVEIRLLRGGAYYGRSAVEGGMSSLCGLAHQAAPAWDADPDCDADPVGKPSATVPFSLGLQSQPDASGFAVGDALATWPPLSGDGMTMAMLSGAELGARLAKPDFQPAEWTALWRGRYGRSLQKSLLLHSIIGSGVFTSALIEAAGFRPAFGQWLMRQARFAGAP